MNFAENVRRELRRRGLRLVDLQKAMSVSRQTLYENLTKDVRISTAARIAAAIDCPLWRLFFDEGTGEICPYCGRPLREEETPTAPGSSPAGPGFRPYEIPRK